MSITFNIFCLQCKDGILPGAPPRTSFHTRCVFTEGGVKCGDRIIPCSKYCRKHILGDKKQVLFRPCNVEKGGVVCQEPVPDIFEDSTCVLHIQLPSQRTYALKVSENEYFHQKKKIRMSLTQDHLQKYESESDEEVTPKSSKSKLPAKPKKEPKDDPVPPKASNEPQKPQAPQTQSSSAQSETDKKEIKTETNAAEDVGTNITICHDGIKQDDSDVIVLETTQTKPILIYSKATVNEPMEK